MYSFGTFARGDEGYFSNQTYKKGGLNKKGDYNNDKITQLIDKLNKTVGENKCHKITNEILKISDHDIANS